MTTYTITANAVGYNSNADPIWAGPARIELVTAADNLTYTTLQTYNGFLDDIAIETEILTVRINGVSVDPSAFYEEGGRIVTQTGLTYSVFAMTYVVPAGATGFNGAYDVQYAFSIGGTALPVFTDLNQGAAFYNGASFAGIPEGDPLGPGAVIPFSGLPGVVTTENDVIFAPRSASVHTYEGGAGDDLLILEPSGFERFDGGVGSDTIDMSGPGFSDLRAVISGSSYLIEHAVGSVALTDVEHIILPDGTTTDPIRFLADTAEAPSFQTGSDVADTLVGGTGADRLDGRGGDDLIEGHVGSDTLIGGAGDDTLSGGASIYDLRDLIYGGDGNDSIDGDHGNDELRGDAGNDTIAGGAGADTVIGGAGDDVMTGSSFGDAIFGGDGFDFINGGFGSDRLNGGNDADRFFHVGVAGHGSDWIQDYDAAEGDVLVFGGNANIDQFQVNIATTANAGNDAIDEAFVIFRPTGQILWALVDGAGQDAINLRIDGQDFDLLA